MLKHESLSLRAIKREDAELLYQNINSPELVCFNAPFKPIHETNHLAWLEKILTDSSKEFFMIDYNDATIGSIQLVDIHPIHRNAELTIRIFKDENRGKNLGTHAVELLCAHAFANLNLIRVWLRVFADNQRAIAAYLKAGFVHEGILKKAAFINGKFVDVVCMGKLKHEF